MVDIDFGHYDPQTDGDPAPGKAHIMIVECDEHHSEKSAKFTYQVLAHEIASEKGKEGVCYVSKSSKSAQNRANLFICAGLVTREELIQAKQLGQSVDLSMGDLEGRQIFCRIREDEDGRVQLGYNSWKRVDDPAASSWPKNEAVLEGYSIAKATAAAEKSDPDDF